MTIYSSSEENSLGTPTCHSVLLLRLFYCISCRVIHCSAFACGSRTGVIHHHNHGNWGPYGLGVNYEAMRKVIIFCRNSYFMFLCKAPSFLFCSEWKTKSHRTSFCSLDSCWWKRMQSIENALNKSQIDWSFSCLFWISDVILCWPAVNAM